MSSPAREAEKRALRWQEAAKVSLHSRDYGQWAHEEMELDSALADLEGEE